jgi:hypothetical protein
MGRFAASFTAIVWLFFGGAGVRQCRAEVILGPSQFGADPSPYFRFTGGLPIDPTATVNNPSFYLPTFDLSGVGWRLPGVTGSLAWNVAMIDSTHFVGAWHVAVGGDMNVGDTINFRPAGTSSIVTGTIAKLQNVPNPDNSTSDVLLGTLSAPVPPGVATYPIAAAAVPQAVMYIYGRQSEVGQNNVSFTQSGISFPIDSNPAHNEVLNGLLYDYDQPNGNPDGLPSTVGNNEAYLNTGDSGGPSFVMIGGQLLLVGTHAAVASYEDVGLTVPPGVADDVAYSLDSNLPAYSAEIAALIAVPEPSSVVLGLFAATAAAGGCIRSRRRSTSA